MTEDDKVLKRGPFKGKKITYASTERIEEFREIASEFMCEIFDLLPGEYLISDESDLRDFTEIGSSDTSPIWERISETYGLVLSDVASERLVSIFFRDRPPKEPAMTPNFGLQGTQASGAALAGLRP